MKSNRIPMKWFVLLQTIFFITACEENQQESFANRYTLEFSKTISYPLDSSTAHSPLDLGLTSWDSNLFYLTNRDLGKVHFYDAYTQEKIGHWYFTSDPKNNLTGSIGLFLFAEDSLLVFKRPLVISLFSNSKSDVLNRTFAELPMYDERNSLRSASVAGVVRPIRVGDSNIIIKLTPVILFHSELNPNATLVDFPILSKVNIFTGEFEDLPISFPTSTKFVHQDLVTIVYLAEAEDYFVVGFVHDPVLYKLDKLSGDLLGSFTVPSQYTVDFTASKGIADGLSLGEFREKNYRYFQMLFDPYRRVFYRQVLHPNHDYEIGTRYYSTMDRPEGFSIMIFDEDFNKLGEVDFPSKTYGYQAWYVGSEGLYISKSNYNNPEMREDFMDFDLFELKALED
ncbi:DUF4221 family protein [Fulvivirgaceae bacterium LMO-SS25]